MIGLEQIGFLRDQPPLFRRRPVIEQA